ncbi:unnamed protein product [Blepharisma stoltei]|uniref:Calponin-homology (CH) domain-containing protein n=1 Tax=Blepharisma stoltei TaxID=1481888 RepID=A0AAU9J378_9CILI|nr:unnamed protein product [Blepharisma stoltei]
MKADSRLKNDFSDLIDWINSFDVPSCLLASSIEDLKSGIVLCDALAYLKSRPLFPDVKRHSNFQKSPKSSAIHNFQVFLREVGSSLPSPLNSYTPQDLFSDFNKLYNILKWLSAIFGHETVNEELTEREIKRPNTSTDSKSLTKNYSKVIQSSPPKSYERAVSTPKARENSSYSQQRLFKTPRSHTPISQAKNRLASPKSIVKKQAAPKTFLPLNKLQDIEQPYDPPQRTRREIRIISDSVKSQVHDWLAGLNIVKNDIIEEASSGTLFCDLINRLEGRQEVIKGIHRTKNKSSIQANINKALSYLRQLEKFSSEHLWNGHNIMDGDENEIWGLLKDIYDYYSISKSQNSQNNSFYSARNNKSPKGLYRFDMGKSTSRILSPRPVITESEQIEPNFLENNRHKEISQETIRKIKFWLRNLGLGHLLELEGKHFLQDPFRNGYIISEVVKTIDGEKSSKAFPSCKNVQNTKENIRLSLDSLKTNHRSIFSSYQYDIDEILNGEKKTIWCLLEELMIENSPHRVLSNERISDPKLLLQLEKSMFAFQKAAPRLPFSKEDELRSPKQISFLEDSRNFSLNRSAKNEDIFPDRKESRQNFSYRSSFNFNWLQIFGINIDMENDVIPEFSSGVLLCEILQKLERRKIPGVDARPKSTPVCLHNVAKALDVLKAKPKFPSKLFFIENDIVNGKGETIRELLLSIFKIYKVTINSLSKFRSKSHERVSNSFL